MAAAGRVSAFHALIGVWRSTLTRPRVAARAQEAALRMRTLTSGL